MERVPKTDVVTTFLFSEPFSKKITWRLGARHDYNQLYNSVTTFNKNAGAENYDVLNPALSSRLSRTGNRFLFTTGLDFKWKDLTVSPTLRYQVQSYQNTLATLPAPIVQKQNSLLPAFGIVYKKLNIYYNKDVVIPGYSSLIPVSDNTNPYFITKGNVDLLPMERHNFSVNYYYSNPKTNFNTYLWSGGSVANNDVVQSITVDDKGVQTYKPVNANGSKNFSANFNISKQYKNNQKFIFSWNAGGYYSMNENLLIYNNAASRQSTFAVNSWMGFGLNFNDKVEWNSSASFGNNFSRYSSNIFKPINNRFIWIDNELVVRLPKHFIWETQFNTDYNSAYTSSNKRIVRWNAAINYTTLKTDALVFKLSVFDILKTNVNFSSSVNRNMITSSQTNTLPQYVMLTATYNVRPSGAPKKKVGGRDSFFLF